MINSIALAFTGKVQNPNSKTSTTPKSKLSYANDTVVLSAKSNQVVDAATSTALISGIRKAKKTCKNAKTTIAKVDSSLNNVIVGSKNIAKEVLKKFKTKDDENSTIRKKDDFIILEENEGKRLLRRSYSRKNALGVIDYVNNNSYIFTFKQKDGKTYVNTIKYQEGYDDSFKGWERCDKCYEISENKIDSYKENYVHSSEGMETADVVIEYEDKEPRSYMEKYKYVPSKSLTADSEILLGEKRKPICYRESIERLENGSSQIYREYLMDDRGEITECEENVYTKGTKSSTGMKYQQRGIDWIRVP